MRVVFELTEEQAGVIYVVDVLKIDESHLICNHKGVERTFDIAGIRNATTVTGRPFSLRPYEASRVGAREASG